MSPDMRGLCGQDQTTTGPNDNRDLRRYALTFVESLRVPASPFKSLHEPLHLNSVKKNSGNQGLRGIQEYLRWERRRLGTKKERTRPQYKEGKGLGRFLSVTCGSQSLGSILIRRWSRPVKKTIEEKEISGNCHEALPRLRSVALTHNK